jgi:ATP-dependent Lon protease
MKIIFPHEQASAEEIEGLLRFSIEGRKRVKDQLIKIDNTFEAVSFGYSGGSGDGNPIKTTEEQEYPQYF